MLFVESLCIVAAAIVILHLFCSRKLSRLHPTPNIKGNLNVVEGSVLFVTAHPDDESMFFAPSIAYLQQKYDVHLLCLSTGNFNGLGKIRKQELFQSGKILSFNSSLITCIDDNRLQDGPAHLWKKEVVAEYVSEYVQKHLIDTIVTFDDRGVSGHANHIAVSLGVRYYTEKFPAPKAYYLKSFPIFIKYLGPLPLFLWMIIYLWSPDSQLHWQYTPYLSFASTAAHVSQFVWYRRLFCLFSCSAYFNYLN